MPCQLDPLIKKLLDSVMKAIFDLEVTLIDWVVTKSVPRIPLQLPCVYGTYILVPISLYVVDLQKNNKRQINRITSGLGQKPPRTKSPPIMKSIS
jgi:hypothetical protein